MSKIGPDRLARAAALYVRQSTAYQGVVVGRPHIAMLMKRMGIEAIYRRPNMSKPAPGHKIYPYLLRGVKIERRNQVWATDVSYIPMRRGFVHLAAVVDVFTRRVLSHRVSITMEAEFCVEALKEALAKCGTPDFSTRIRTASLLASTSPACSSMRCIDQYGRERRPARQRLRRATVAQREI